MSRDSARASSDQKTSSRRRRPSGSGRTVVPIGPANFCIPNSPQTSDASTPPSSVTSRLFSVVVSPRFHPPIYSSPSHLALSLLSCLRWQGGASSKAAAKLLSFSKSYRRKRQKSHQFLSRRGDSLPLSTVMSSLIPLSVETERTDPEVERKDPETV
ncbi:Uncharacterized protein Rs2_09804 [Raphanus sativus]|nr:Uncharacterized protein Rs2_09804 [Raphanus sativus]